MRSALIALAVAAVAEAFAPVCPTAVSRRAPLPGPALRASGGARPRPRARLLARPPGRAVAGHGRGGGKERVREREARGRRRPRLARGPSGACVFVGYSHQPPDAPVQHSSRTAFGLTPRAAGPGALTHRHGRGRRRGKRTVPNLARGMAGCREGISEGRACAARRGRRVLLRSG